MNPKESGEKTVVENTKTQEQDEVETCCEKSNTVEPQWFGNELFCGHCKTPAWKAPSGGGD